MSKTKHRYHTFKYANGETQIRSDIIHALKAKVQFEVICHPEETEIEGNASAIDPKTDRSIEQSIREELEMGNQWAWCTIEVKAKFGEFEGSDFLGCCSYKSQDEFEESGGYFDDMKAQAFEALVITMIKASHSLKQAFDGKE